MTRDIEAELDRLGLPAPPAHQPVAKPKPKPEPRTFRRFEGDF